MRSILTFCCLLSSILAIAAVDPNARVDSHPNIMGEDHMNRHLERLNRDKEEMLHKLNNPDVSIEEKTRTKKLLELISRQIESLQARVDTRTKEEERRDQVETTHKVRTENRMPLEHKDHLMNMDADVDPTTDVLNRMNHHLADMTNARDIMLDRLNDPAISPEEKASVNKRLEMMNGQIAMVQNHIETQTKTMKRDERRREMENVQRESMDRLMNMDKDTDVDPATNILNHMNLHLERLNFDHEEMLDKLNDPSISPEEKASVNNRIAAIKDQIAKIQNQVEIHTKNSLERREMEKMHNMHKEKMNKRNAELRNTEI